VRRGEYIEYAISVKILQKKMMKAYLSYNQCIITYEAHLSVSAKYRKSEEMQKREEMAAALL